MSEESFSEIETIDPELIREMERLTRQDQVQDLYLTLITECETRHFPLFQKISSWNLEEFLYERF